MSTSSDYVALIESFLAGKTTAEVFQTKFFELHYATDPQVASEDSEVLDQLLVDVDSFCGDPTTRTEIEIDEAQLRVYANEALQKLKALNRL